MTLALSDITRRLGNLIALGTIAEVDHPAFRVRVRLSGRLTGWLPVPADISANYRRWRPLRVGTQVLVCCPSGDPANAIIVQILYTTPLPPPSTDGMTDLILWDDGSFVRYDAAQKRMEAHSAGDLTLSAVNTLTLDAKNIAIHTGSDGFYHLDHHGFATRITHKGGPAFETRTWKTGVVVTAQPDQGYAPPKVEAS